MDQVHTEIPEQTASAAGVQENTPATVAPSTKPTAQAIAPQVCANCGSAAASNGGTPPAPRYVYAIGRIEPRFPGPSLEKEFAQATGRPRRLV